MSRIALIGENSIEYVSTLLDIWNSGDCAVLIDWRIPIQTAVEMMNEAEVHVCYIEKKYYGKVSGARSQCITFIPFERKATAAGHLPESVYDRFKPNYSKNEAVVLYSSGTTGKSKGIILSHFAINTNADAIIDYMKPNAGDCIYIAKTFSHSSTLTGELLVSLKTQTKLVIAPTIVPPRYMLGKIREFNVTIICLNPTLLSMLANEVQRDKDDIPSLRTIYVSGSVLNNTTYVKAHDTFRDIPVYNVYGLSEAGPRVAAQREGCCSSNSVGSPILGVEIVIVDENGTPVTEGERGTVHVTTPSQFCGYISGQVKQQSMYRDWLNTGDIGYINDNGELHITGRVDDVIVLDAHKIYPCKIENMPWAIDTIIRIITFISGLVMFLSYDWIVGLIYIATYIPGAIVSYKHKEKVDQWSIDNIPEARKKDYYKILLTGSFAAKDLRLYNLAEHFKQKYNELWDKIRSEREKLFAKGSVASFLASLLTYSGIVVIILLSVRSILLGSMAIGTLALYIGLAQTSGENFGNIIDDIACQIEITIPHVICYIDFLKYENVIKDDGKEPIPINPEIEFRDVYFKYPGNEEYTLKNLNFKISCGKKIALIGVNGAGKTTIIKLLLRFYEPESGEILLAGKNIRSYPLCEVHKMFGVCFQDVSHYSLTFRENIAISDIGRKDDTDSVKESAKASGADKMIADLEEGLETDMTRQFNDKGAELSGGQWQKVAISRAFFRKSQFIILDEPSSALDPEAEDYIFSSFKRLCRDKGGILISHRLSGVMMVDEIILLDNGTVIESGTHTELINKNGKYAEMYHMQSEKYKEGAENA